MAKTSRRSLGSARSSAFLSALVACGAAHGAGCGGEQHWTGDAAWSPEPSQSSRPLRETMALEDPNPQAGGADAGASAWVGVRHDLMLGPSAKRKATCSCLAVQVGQPSDDRFAWQNGAPPLGSDVLAVAISARGVECPGGEADETRRRASIAGVERDDKENVIVEIEELPEGRPIASGVIVPKPPAGAGVYVRGRSDKLPYARAEGPGCKVR